MRNFILLALCWFSFSVASAEDIFKIVEIYPEGSEMATEEGAKCVLWVLGEDSDEEACQSEAQANLELSQEMIGEDEKKGFESSALLKNVLTENFSELQLEQWPFACLSQNAVDFLVAKHGCVEF